MSSGYITYEQFGAKGDGRADDMPAIIAAHEEANEKQLPVRAKEGAVYYIAPVAASAVIKTDTDWSGAEFIIDDVGLDDIHKPVFDVPPAGEKISFPIASLKAGQDRIPNPTGKELIICVVNDNHRDYIRFGANQNNGHSRTDNLLLLPDGTLSSPVSFDFDEITSVSAETVPETKLTLKGGKFTTIANQCESKYNYHSRNISVRRSNTDICGISHYVMGELDHGAPYGGFLSVSGCAHVTVDGCLFTGHKTYWTIGAAGVPVPMGSYDINCGSAIDVTFRHCRQTTDIMDRDYWGVIGSNFCRELVFDDCVFSRFDAHMGVNTCLIRNCRLGHQCLNAIGFGRFTVENTEAYGYAFVTLRGDYGCTWKGDFEIRNCVWHPAGDSRSVFHASNNGTHDFGYQCWLPQNIVIDGLTVAPADGSDTECLYVINDWTDKEAGESPYQMIPPVRAEIRNVSGAEKVEYCPNPARKYETEFVTA